MTTSGYGYRHALLYSFFSKSFYRDVAYQWRGTGFSYLLVLMLLLGVAMVYVADQRLTLFQRHQLTHLLEQMPTVIIRSGQVSIDRVEPYYLNTVSGDPFLVVDTTGQYQTLESSRYPMLLTRNELIMKKDLNSEQHYSIPEDANIIIDRAMVETTLANYSVSILCIAYFVIVLSIFFYRIMQTLLYSLPGLVFNKLFSTQLSYLAILRLVAVALTPAVLIDALCYFLFEHYRLGIGLYGLLALLYLSYGVYACRHQNHNTEGIIKKVL